MVEPEPPYTCALKGVHVCVPTHLLGPSCLASALPVLERLSMSPLELSASNSPGHKSCHAEGMG